MRISKILVVLLCAAVLLSALFGCKTETGGAPEDSPQSGAAQDGASQGGAAQDSKDSEDSGEAAEESDWTKEIDFAAAFEAFAPDTEMIAVGGYTISWAELFFLFREQLRSGSPASVGVMGLSHIMEDGRTYAETVKENAADSALRFRSYEYGANLIGFEVTEDQRSFLYYSAENMIDSVGSEESFLELLWLNNSVKDRELFDYLLYQDYLPYFIFQEMYGGYGESLSDEDMARMTEGENYMTAKHIMRMKDDSGDLTPKRELEIVLRQLRSYDGEYIDDFFDSLMFEHSQDEGGLYDFPDGYLFRPTEMEASFDAACMALEIGEISDVIETEVGFHIIYRLPINYDIVPIVETRQGETDSLRILKAMDLFEIDTAGWRGALTPVFSDVFRSIDLSAIFVPR